MISASNTQYVVLLHGLARTGRSMTKLADGLAAEGFEPINVDYPSRKYSIEELAGGVLRRTLEPLRKRKGARIHFVTHSLGGIIVRYHLKHNKLGGLGRVVMLTPPNQGSELADLLKHSPVFKISHGPAGQQLGTADGFLRELGPVRFDLGVIAGQKSLDPVSRRIIPGPNDGRVSVESTKVPGMKDFLIVPFSHAFIMRRREVIDQVVHFLRHGIFLHDRTS